MIITKRFLVSSGARRRRLGSGGQLVIYVLCHTSYIIYHMSYVICICMFICMIMYIICTHIIYTISIYIHIYQTYTYVCVYIYICICMHVCVYIYIYNNYFTYIYIYIYIYIYREIRAYTRSGGQLVPTACGQRRRPRGQDLERRGAKL